MITELNDGEIIRIKNKEYVLINKQHNNGFMDFGVYHLKLLNKLIVNDKRSKPYKMGFKSLKLTNIELKGGLKE